MKFEFDARYGKEFVQLEEGFANKHELTTVENSLGENVSFYTADVPALISALQEAYIYSLDNKGQQ